MSPHTKTRPLSDHSYWRRLRARVHPDQGGSQDLFIWVEALREHFQHGPCAIDGAHQEDREVSRDEQRRSRGRTEEKEEPDRIPFDLIFFGRAGEEEFVNLTIRALKVGREAESIYGEVLALLVDCAAHDHGREVPRQSRGASYKQLAAIAHTRGMSKRERVGWYRVAEEIPLSDRHAGHILSKLKRRAA